MLTRTPGAIALLFILTTQPAFNAEIPVKEVILYKHGIAFLEREGAVPAGEEAGLDFKSTDMNDMVESPMVSEEGGGRVSGVRYDSNEPLDEPLAPYPFLFRDIAEV